MDMDFVIFIGKMKELNLLNIIFIDNIVSVKVVGFYEDIFNLSISILMFNKIVVFFGFVQYQCLKVIVV